MATLSFSIPIFLFEPGHGSWIKNLFLRLKESVSIGIGMIRVKALYSLPSIKQILVIACFQNTDSDNPKLSGTRKLRKQEIERIRMNIGRTLPNNNLKWSIRVVQEHDFLRSLQGTEYTSPTPSNQTLDNPESMEMLAINLLKTPRSSEDLSCNTPKVLSKVPDEDIIEVFI